MYVKTCSLSDSATLVDVTTTAGFCVFSLTLEDNKRHLLSTQVNPWVHSVFFMSLQPIWSFQRTFLQNASLSPSFL